MKKLAILLLILIVILIGFSTAAFVVDEQKQAFITQFGKPVRAVQQPGIHFKIPLIQKVRFFDRRFLEWDGEASQVITKDKRSIFIDTYARWQIEDPLLFFQNVIDERNAQTRMDDVLDGATRNAVASHDLVDIVRSEERSVRTDAVTEVEQEAEIGGLSAFKTGRHAIADTILKEGKRQLKDWGIALLDFQFKRINYEEDVQQKIFERMISERQRIASKFRSEGQGEASRINGQRERELKRIESEAYRKSQEIIGQADAEAARIYAEAYDQSPDSREFYGFLKTMETYEKTLSNKDWLMLSTKSDFYRYLNTADPESKAVPASRTALNQATNAPAR